MKKSILFVLLSIVFFGCLQVDNSQPDTIVITTDKTQYIVGETISVTVKNNSGRPVFYNRCTSTNIGGKGWFPNCSIEKISDLSTEKTVFAPPCPSDVENFESPNAIAKLETGQTITQNFPFTRTGKLPICLQAEFSYFSFCDRGNCTGNSVVESDWMEVVRK